MAFYVSADALLADVRLRLEGLGEGATALVVEGYDDKRIFYDRISLTADVVPAGGKRLLRAGLAAISETDKGRILFLTDCDYDVFGGMLQGGPDVVITNSCDVESDLINLGILEEIVVEVIPGVVQSKGSSTRVAEDVRQCAEAISVPMGRVRMAAQPLGVDLDLENLDLGKYWDSGSRQCNIEKLNWTVCNKLRRAGVRLSKGEWEQRLADTPTDAIVCNGKDLFAAAQMIMRTQYKMSNKYSFEIIVSMARLSLDEERFERWSVVRRIRQWEKRNSAQLLSAAA